MIVNAVLSAVFAFLITTEISYGNTDMNAPQSSLKKTLDQRSLDQRLKEFPNLYIVQHPLINHKMAIVRNKSTGTHAFRQLLSEIALLIGYEVTKTLSTQEISLETPVDLTIGHMIQDKSVVIVPVLRAGLSMAEGLHSLIPTADFAHIGLARDPNTKLPTEYLFKVPPIKNQKFIVVDPMLATGGSAAYAVSRLMKAGVPSENILFMALVVAPEGMRNFQKEHPTIPVFAAALDDHLNEHAYIVPGLGDAGDRLYGTE